MRTSKCDALSAITAIACTLILLSPQAAVAQITMGVLPQNQSLSIIDQFGNCLDQLRAKAQAPDGGTAVSDAMLGRQFHLENDIGFADRWYTQQMHLSWTYNAASLNSLFSRMALCGAAQVLPDKSQGDQDTTLSYSVGQTLYTPRDIKLTNPPLDDRPWGAFAWLGVAAHGATGKVFSATELKLGVVGPAAAGEFVQSNWHQLIHSARPAGWDQQLQQRLGLQLAYAKVHRADTTLFDQRLGFQYGLGGALGSVRTYGNLNATLVMGDLKGSKSPLFIPNEGDFVLVDYSDRAMLKKTFAFFSIGATVVAYNYFLSGSTPYGQPQIRVIPWVGSAQLGISLPLHTWFTDKPSPYWPRLVVTSHVRGPEFESTLAASQRTDQRWTGFTFNWDLN